MSIEDPKNDGKNAFALTALSPLDGRYSEATTALRQIASEYGLIRNRVKIELEWIKFLAAESSFPNLKDFSPSGLRTIAGILENFDVGKAEKIKEIEQSTNHDVKAVEYFLKAEFAEDKELKQAVSFIHFACTSEDINNLAYGLMLEEAKTLFILPDLANLESELVKMANEFASQPMLSRTHGQTASPTTMGKEMANYAHRLKVQTEKWKTTRLEGKFNGAVGNYNAHIVAEPSTDWPKLAELFVSSIGLAFNPYTTQIEPHDTISEYCDYVARLNTILIDLCRDLWGYISLGYFRQKKNENEVGSSTMPHKINPIDFENAEGNLGLANALLKHFSGKLPISRWQRDLTDSTVLRNLGCALGYSITAYRSINKGVDKLELDSKAIEDDLDDAWEILAEPIQTVMRMHGIEDSYEQLKALSRGQKINRELLHRFIGNLDLPETTKNQLRKLTPKSYLGNAEKLARAI